MKKKPMILLRWLLIPLSILTIIFSGPAGIKAEELKGTVSLSGAWALYPMAVKWAEEFRKLHPGVQVDVQAGGAGKGIADALAGMVDIGMVSRDIHPAEVDKGAWAVAVTKDGVVPTASGKNPFQKELLKKGISRDVFVRAWITDQVKTWDDILGNAARQPVHVFTRSDACGAAETWAAFLGNKQEDLLGVAVYGDPGLADAVIRDPLALGYNNINFAYDANTKKPLEGIIVVPVDLNHNGRVDPEESFMSTRDEITAAIKRGAYPSPPARDLYFVTKGRPEKPAVREFIRWILTQGQVFVPDTGYIPLDPEKLNKGLKKLD
ncbi:MAG: PstS family phosphate ABC transporter substrate-binding protein [Candidatus Aminicenantales bacterium]